MARIGILLCVALAVLGARAADKCHWSEMAACGIEIAGTFTDRDKSIPIDDAGVDKICSVLKETAECLTNYSTKCIPKAQRDMIMGAEKDPNGQEVVSKLKELCQPGSALRQRYLNLAPCLREAASSEETKSCVRDVMAAIEKSGDAADVNSFDASCCTMNRFEKCSRNSVEKKCGADAMEYSNFVFFDSQMYKMMKRVCSCMGEESVTCVSLLPPAGTPLTGKKPRGPLGQAYQMMNEWLKRN